MENKYFQKNGLKTLDKALSLLEYISSKEKDMGKEIGISEINKSLNLGLSTIHRILTTFKMRGYLLQNKKTLKYRLGIKLFELGCKVRNSNQLIEISKPYLIKLSQKTNETANLAILEGIEVIYIDKAESSEVLTTNIKVGARLPANCTSLGKAMLAFISEEKLNSLYKGYRKLPALSNNSITSLEKLKNSLKEVRELGYAIDREEYKIGVNCVAVPIKDKTGNVIAAISLTGPASRFTPNEEKGIKNLMSVSKEISIHI